MIRHIWQKLSFISEKFELGNKAAKGIKMAREAKSLFLVKFEEMVDRPIDDVRKELNIIPIKEGPSWYQYPKIKDDVIH